jgi:hypothetical protein
LLQSHACGRRNRIRQQTRLHGWQGSTGERKSMRPQVPASIDKHENNNRMGRRESR